VGTVRSYRDLTVWQRAMDLVEAVYRLTRRIPATERFGVAPQAQRAAVSVVANIAEGFGRGSSGDYARALRIARASVLELETVLMVGARVGYFGAKELVPLADLSDQVSRMLWALEKKVRAGGAPKGRG